MTPITTACVTFSRFVQTFFGLPMSEKSLMYSAKIIIAFVEELQR